MKKETIAFLSSVAVLLLGSLPAPIAVTAPTE
jgi:hypothetical protein